MRNQQNSFYFNTFPAKPLRLTETILKALTAVGSFLGTVAFVQNLTKEVTATNKAHWEKLAAIISPLDLHDIQYDLETDRIRLDSREKMQHLASVINRSDLNIVGFKSLLGSRIRKKLQYWLRLYWSFQKHVQVPYWNPQDKPLEGGGLWQGYKLNKELFYENLTKATINEDLRAADKKLNQHRDTVLSLARQMETVLIDVQRLANRDAFEYILPWKWGSRK